jgi:hypothetical protein
MGTLEFVRFEPGLEESTRIAILFQWSGVLECEFRLMAERTEKDESFAFYDDTLSCLIESSHEDALEASFLKWGTVSNSVIALSSESAMRKLKMDVKCRHRWTNVKFYPHLQVECGICGEDLPDSLNPFDYA